MVRVAARTGSATSWPPFSAATSGASPISMWRKMFSSTTTELSISRENASAKPPSTMVLTVPPLALSAMKAASADSGMERNTATVARMLPRNSKIIRPVRTRPIAPSCKQVLNGLFHEDRLVEDHLGHQLFGNIQQMGDRSLIPSTTEMVLVSPPCFRIGR